MSKGVTFDGQRETLRRIIAKHIGLSEIAQANGEPADEEDFYLIGGDSITVGEAIEFCLRG